MVLVCEIELSWAKTEPAVRIAAHNTRCNAVDIREIIFLYPATAYSIYSKQEKNVVIVNERKTNSF